MRASSITCSRELFPRSARACTASSTRAVDVSSPAQVGLVRVASSERYKGGTRVSFHSGPRARATLFGEDDAMRVLAKQLVCPIEGVGAGVERLRAELTASQGESGRLRSVLA